MTGSNYWVENYVSYLSSRNAGVHQSSKDFKIEVSESVDFNPSIDVYVARGDKKSIQVPKSTKYHKVNGFRKPIFCSTSTRLFTDLTIWTHQVESTISIQTITPNTMNLSLS